MDDLLSYIKERLEEEFSFYDEMADRFGLPYCILLVQSPEAYLINVYEMMEYFRKVDRIKRVAPDMIAVFFLPKEISHQKLVVDRTGELLQERGVENYHMGVACSKRGDTTDDVLGRAYKNLTLAIAQKKHAVCEFCGYKE